MNVDLNKKIYIERMYIYSMPIIVLFIISILGNVGVNFSRKLFGIKYATKSRHHFLFCGSIELVVAIIFCSLLGFNLSCSTFTLVIGLIFGLVTFGSYIATNISVKRGSLSITSMICQFSTIITALSGLIFWNEQVSAAKYVALAFIAVSFIFVALPEKGTKTKIDTLSIILAVVACFLSAGIGLLQKYHQSNADYKNETLQLLAIAFLIGVLFNGASYLFLLVRAKKQKEEIIVPKVNKSNYKSFLILIGIVLLAGVGGYVANHYNLYLSGQIPSAVFFPIINGVPFLLTLIMSFIVFKEKLNKMQIIGLISGIIAIVLLVIPI